MAKVSLIWLRAAEAVVRLELDTADNFLLYAESHFDHEFEKLKNEQKRHPRSYWEEELDFGSTRGDLLGERAEEVGGMQQLNRYFGVLVTYSILERFLHALFREAKRLNLIKDSGVATKRFLDFKGYVDVLKKDLRIDLRTKQKEYAQLTKLLAMRNAIVHFGGWVHAENANFLKPYGYGKHDRIRLSEGYFSENKDLINDTCLFIAKGYERFLRNQKMI